MLKVDSSERGGLVGIPYKSATEALIEALIQDCYRGTSAAKNVFPTISKDIR